MAGSGWCHHPSRKTTSDLLIMVRKNELACRDAWSHSLWEAGKFEDDVEADDGASGASFAARPVAPASDTDIAALLQATLAPAEGPREDVVLSEVRVAPAPASEPVPVSDPAASYRDLDARSAIIKAREAYRERIRLDPRRLFEEPVVAAASLPAADPEPLLGESPWGGEPAATCRNEPLDEADGVVEVDDDDIDDMAEQFVSTLAVDHMEPAADRDAFGLDEWDDVDDDAVRAPAAESWLTRGMFGGFGRFIHLRGSATAQPEPQAGADAFEEPIAEPEPEPATSELAHPSWDSDPEALFDAIVDRLAGEEGASVESARDAAPRNDSARFGYRPAALRGLAVHDDEIRTTADDSPEGAASIVDFIDALPDIVIGPELAPDLPRVCRTCRDFRPSESGGRGWCANRWAFSHRRVVDAHDAAPCATSLGNWWLPVDEVWAAAYDISSHGQPTPLLDGWLGGQERDAEPKRRRS